MLANADEWSWNAKIMSSSELGVFRAGGCKMLPTMRYLLLTEPVELVGMLKSQHKCPLMPPLQPVELVEYHSHSHGCLGLGTSGGCGMLKPNLNARYLILSPGW
jgi:hypothetical protein